MSEPLPLSLVIIARDAAHELADCLASAAFAAEAIVVESGSSDDTAAVATRSGARVIVARVGRLRTAKEFRGRAGQRTIGCFASTPTSASRRNSKRRSARCSWAPGRRRRRTHIARRNRFLGRWLAHGEGYPDWNIRLFDRRRARWSDDVVHEKVVADGPVATLRGDLLHASAESIDAYIAKQNRYTSAQATAMHARGERASAAQMMLSPAARFVRFYVFRLGFLDGAAGFAHIAIGAFSSFLKYAKLRALQEGGRPR